MCIVPLLVDIPYILGIIINAPLKKAQYITQYIVAYLGVKSVLDTRYLGIIYTLDKIIITGIYEGNSSLN